MQSFEFGRYLENGPNILELDGPQAFEPRPDLVSLARTRLYRKHSVACIRVSDCIIAVECTDIHHESIRHVRDGFVEFIAMRTPSIVDIRWINQEFVRGSARRLLRRLLGLRDSSRKARSNHGLKTTAMRGYSALTHTRHSTWRVPGTRSWSAWSWSTRIS